MKNIISGLQLVIPILLTAFGQILLVNKQKIVKTSCVQVSKRQEDHIIDIST